MNSARFTILVAEDEDEMRDFVGGALRGQGYDVLEATYGAAALDLATRHNGPIHLLLTDISMPGLSGWELYRRLSSERPGTATLFMSHKFNSSLRQYAPFLPKPFEISDLLTKVCYALKRSPASKISQRTM